MNELLDLIAKALTSNTGNTVFSGGILLLAIIAYNYRFRPTCRKIKRHLDDANKRINSIKTQNELAQKFEEFQGWIRQNKLLSSAWDEFSETLLFPKQNERNIVRNSVDPDVYFNDDSILASNLNLRVYTNLPNVLTGLGLLGTFVGLVAGIHLAVEDLGKDNEEDIKRGLQSLLNGASLAFMTSVCGLIAALIFSFFEKRRLHDIRNSISAWNSYLSRLLERVTPEQLVAQQVIETTKQSLQLERFNTDLAVSIAESLNNRLTSSFGPVFTKIANTVEGMSKSQATAQEEMLTTIASKFQHAVSGAAGTEMESMRNAFSELNLGLLETTRRMADGQNQMITATKKLTEGLGTALEQNVLNMQSKIEEVISDLVIRLETAAATASDALARSGTTTAESIGGSAQAISYAVSALTPLVGRVADLLKGHESSLQTMRQLTIELNKVHESLGEVAAPIEEAILQLKASANASAQGLLKVSETSNSLKNTADSIVKAQEMAADAWENYENRFSGVDISLKKIFEEINEAQAAHSEQVRSFVTEMDSEFAKALQALNGVVKELSEIAEMLQESRSQPPGAR